MWNQESEKNIMIVGHRGIRSLYPENTMVSFRAALELKLDLIEFDVHFTKDKKIVVCHDADIERTTNGSGLIGDMTLEELKTYDAGIKMGEEFAGECIPTLEEVLDLMAHADYEVLLNVEMKDYDHELVDQTIDMLKKFGMAERSVIAWDTDEKQMAEDVAMAKKYHIRPWLFCADDEESTIKAVKAGATNITCNNPYATIKYLTEQGLRKPL